MHVYLNMCNAHKKREREAAGEMRQTDVNRNGKEIKMYGTRAKCRFNVCCNDYNISFLERNEFIS